MSFLLVCRDAGSFINVPFLLHRRPPGMLLSLVYRDSTRPTSMRKLKSAGGHRLTFDVKCTKIAIGDEWRICFHWRDGDALEMEVVDYHKG
jgi:proteic killer suppression protein